MRKIVLPLGEYEHLKNHEHYCKNNELNKQNMTILQCKV